MFICELSNSCRCFGIEIADNAAHYGVELLSEFQKSAKHNGMPLADIELHHGDFLKNAHVKEAMSTAAFVYLNNPRFGPELNLKVLSKHFQNKSFFFEVLSVDDLCPLMPKGGKLICFDSLIGTKGYYHPTLNYKKTLKVGIGAVSWKHSGVDLHVLERS